MYWKSFKIVWNVKAWFLSCDRKKVKSWTEEGGRALCVFGECSQQHRLTGNGVFFACWAIPLVLVWQGGDKCAELTDPTPIIYLPLYQAVCFSPARVYLSAEQQLGPVIDFFYWLQTIYWFFLWFTVTVRRTLLFCFLTELFFPYTDLIVYKKDQT